MFGMKTVSLTEHKRLPSERVCMANETLSGLPRTSWLDTNAVILDLTELEEVDATNVITICPTGCGAANNATLRFVRDAGSQGFNASKWVGINELGRWYN
jgi:hypothetical protein